jgi:GTPase SAR1 family protein
MKKKITEVIALVEKTYAGLGETARMVLAGAATTRLERQHPLSIILIGGPSSGKTTLLIPLTRGSKDTALRQSVLRLDDFTPASLVSHAANRKTDDLAKIDILPKMSGKCVITKEMAPMFTGHEDELMKKFAVFASILDGEGYVSGSGSHGQRGYSERIVFTLMGAVTPEVLSRKVSSTPIIRVLSKTSTSGSG